MFGVEIQFALRATLDFLFYFRSASRSCMMSIIKEDIYRA
jgi:hypothetical protein